MNEHGGAVVEFNGDGMMAVFGAPRPLARKEHAALRAGAGHRRRHGRRPRRGSRAGLAARSKRAWASPPGSPSSAACAPSTAACGRALGNTTNLAARLQALTRDLDASIIVDSATFAAAPDAAAGFVAHREHAIRGRSERVDLHALPRESAADVHAPERA